MTIGRLKPKIVQVPVDETFLARIDKGASVLRESRAGFVREACEMRLRSLEEAEQERRYESGYERRPEDLDWAGMAAAELARRLKKETW